MVATKTAVDDRRLLEQMVEEAYRMPNWNATSLRAALRRVTPEMAGWRPPNARRSIADIVVHCAYWKYALRRRLSGDRRGGFPYPGSNWFKTDSPPNRERWVEYLALLEHEHLRLCEAIRAGPSKIRPS